MLNKRLLFLIVFIIYSISSCQTETKIPSLDAYTNITIIDGKGNKPLANYSLIIEDSVIKDIIPNKDLAKGNYNLIDCKNAFVLPGFIDTHIHSTVLKFDSKKGHSEDYDKVASMASLKTMLKYGVTSVKSVANPTKAAIELRNITQDSSFIYPNLFTSGYALNKSNYPPFKRMKTKAEVSKEIKNQKENGVDFVKVYASLEPELTKFAIEEAHKNDIKVVGHLQRTNWTEASNYGIDFITHAAPWSKSYLNKKDQKKYFPNMKGRLFWIEKVDYSGSQIKEMISTMKKSGVIFDPTLIVFHTKFWENDGVYQKNPTFNNLPTTLKTMWNSASFVADWEKKDFIKAQKLWPKLSELTKLIYEEGIMITTGTDFPNPWVYPGKSLHQEMQLLKEAGIPILQVLKAATFNGAVSLGIEKSHGSIEKGKIADLVFLSKNPIENIQNTKSIKWVFKNGERLN